MTGPSTRDSARTADACTLLSVLSHYRIAVFVFLWCQVIHLETRSVCRCLLFHPQIKGNYFY